MTFSYTIHVPFKHFPCFFARSEQSAQYLAEMFRQNKIRKTYWSVTIGTPKYDQGDICIPIKEDVVNGHYKSTVDKGEQNKNIKVSF